MPTQADETAPTIDRETFERMLLDPGVPDEALRPYLMEGAAQAGFQPTVQANPARVIAPETESALLLGSLNGIARWRRQQRYRSKIRTWTGVRIVSEGDSWFQYPLLLTDVIDWLSEPYAIFSLDAAGDLLADMVKQGEVVTAVVQERPHVVLLSGGGNDLLGGSHLSTAVLPFEPGRLPDAYLGTAFGDNLKTVLDDLERLLSRLQAVAPDTPVLTHVYDHAIPANGQWLGKPLASVGITDRLLQRAIVRAIVDRFHAALIRLVGSFPHVRVIDTRGLVRDDRWHDELHPNDQGFQSVAQRFAVVIAEMTGAPTPNLATEAAVEAVSLVQTMDAEPLLDALLDQHPDDALLREIGRREALAAAGDTVPDEPLAIFPSSVEGAFPELRELGLRAVAEAGRAVLATCCSSGNPAYAALDQAIRSGRTALIQHLVALLARPDKQPGARTMLIAAALAQRAVGTDADALCRGLAAMTD